jgi:ribosomal protein L37E
MGLVPGEKPAIIECKKCGRPCFEPFDPQRRICDACLLEKQSKRMRRLGAAAGRARDRLIIRTIKNP